MPKQSNPERDPKREKRAAARKRRARHRWLAAEFAMRAMERVQ